MVKGGFVGLWVLGCVDSASGGGYLFSLGMKEGWFFCRHKFGFELKVRGRQWRRSPFSGIRLRRDV
jgi:hypothetical protein